MDEQDEVAIGDQSSTSLLHNGTTFDSKGVLSGGTGEASQETLQLHFQKVIGLSPIAKLESEAQSHFTLVNLHPQGTDLSQNSNFQQAPHHL